MLQTILECYFRKDFNALGIPASKVLVAKEIKV
jgi:hypothetical protein